MRETEYMGRKTKRKLKMRGRLGEKSLFERPYDPTGIPSLCSPVVLDLHKAANL